MAYTFGNSARLPATATTTNANPATFTINCPANTKVLWLGIVVGGTTARAGGSPTYNGVAMTAGVAKTNAGGTAETNAETWYMLNPPTGSSLTISVPNTGGLAMTLMAATGVNTAVGNPSRAGGTATPGSSTNPTGNSSTGAVGDIIFGRVGDGATTWNPSGRTGTQIYDWDAGTWGGGSQYIVAGTTAAVAVGWTMNVNEDWIVETDRFTFTVTQNDLTADDLSSGTPTLTSPAVGQTHALGANDVASGAPTLSSPALHEVHALLADDISAGVPTLSSPSLTEQAADHLSADDLTTGAPTLGSPALGQVHTLTAVDLSTAQPTLTTPALSQTHALAADDLTGTAPSLTSPALGQVHVLLADDITVATPTLSLSALGQVHVILADDLIAGVPELTAPVLIEAGAGVDALLADDITAGTPVLSTPTLSEAPNVVVFSGSGHPSVTRFKSVSRPVVLQNGTVVGGVSQMKPDGVNFESYQIGGELP